jgi:hypothetical protein
MTANDRDLELATLDAVLHSTQTVDLATELHTAVDAGHFTDPWVEAAVVAALDVLDHVDTNAHGALMLATHERLVATGTHRDRDFHHLVLPEVDTATLNQLPMLLGKLEEAAARRKVTSGRPGPSSPTSARPPTPPPARPTPCSASCWPTSPP